MKKITITLLVLFLVSCSPTEIEIGAVIPLTGPGAFLGESLQNGMMLATDEIGDFTVIYEDSKASPKEGLTAYQKIKATHDPIATIVAFSGVSKALLPVMDQDKMPMFMTLVSGSGYAAQSEYAFRYFTNADMEAPIMADFAIEEGYNDFAVLYIDDEYGNDYFRVFSETVEKNNGNIVAAETFTRADADFKTQLFKIDSANPDAVYIVGYDSHLLLILKQAAEVGVEAQLMTNWVLASPTNIEKAGSTAENVLITTPAYYLADNTEFAQKYIARYGKSPDAYAALGYDTIYVLKDALDNASTKEELVEELKQTNLEGLMGKISASAEGEMNFALYPAIVENGKVKAFQ